MAITVIIPVHNMANTVSYAVESALDADRVILVNDGSNDNSVDYIKAAVKNYSHVVCVRTNSPVPSGVCHARNLAIARADDDSLIIPLDADDMLFPNAVATYAAAWQPGTCVYGGWLEFDPVRDTGREIMPLPPEAIERQDIARGLCFHKTDWLRAGGYNPLFNIGGEDYAFMLALVRAGVRLTRLEAILYNYNISRDTRANAAGRRWPCIKQMVEEQYGRLGEAHSATR